MAAPVTAIYAAFFTVFIMALAFRVVSMRFGKRVGLGAGGHADLRRAIRVHGIRFLRIGRFLHACYPP